MNPMNSLRGKVVLVTGGAVRIGRAIVEALAAEGAIPVIHYRNSGRAADRLAARLRTRGRKCFTVRGDLVSEAACVAVLTEARRKAGRLDVLVNSAASFNKHRLMEISAGRLLEEFWPNLFSPLLLMRHFAAHARTGSVIINLLDRRITGHDTSCLPYLLTKKALADATLAAAIELAPRIRVHGICPGPVLPPPGRNRAYLVEKGGPVLTARRPKPADIAAGVLYLIRAESSTGQILFVDGGQNLIA